MTQPLIGVLPLYDEAKESYWMLPGYMKGIEDAGGAPVMLPLTTDENIILSLANQFDGFLFTGGHDINPEMYGEKVGKESGIICTNRDIMEEILFKRVLELDKPALGICRGLQLFNVMLGGTLYQDIPTQMKNEKQVKHKQRPPYDRAVHRVDIKKDSRLFDMLHRESIFVNSLHHQGIKQLSPKLVPMAQAEDELIEAAYMPEQKYVLAVQWHPEFNYQKDDNQFTLFVDFIRSCQK
ncbi:putative glutamine amidotransferase [Salinibacillus kushneri]|uniref:Putative glutamine amidotransferase n=1 Tax=Salinibacillus kushneri TaxID=237682 RepID=A0A1I0EWS8_9BACI|nr:gamma-glutamyl-gamma-aminobutyrate hydrolase family protein [Salinibacillus kushneri]SET49843.1 putative glutamine amidotransferase [Salinibacillus kushneri]